jgi:hypothetical protein
MFPAVLMPPRGNPEFKVGMGDLGSAAVFTAMKRLLQFGY